MAISVILDLSQKVTLKDIKHFLSFAPASMSEDDPINVHIQMDKDAAFLEIPV